MVAASTFTDHDSAFGAGLFKEEVSELSHAPKVPGLQLFERHSTIFPAGIIEGISPGLVTEATLQIVFAVFSSNTVQKKVQPARRRRGR